MPFIAAISRLPPRHAFLLLFISYVDAMMMSAITLLSCRHYARVSIIFFILMPYAMRCRDFSRCRFYCIFDIAAIRHYAAHAFRAVTPFFTPFFFRLYCHLRHADAFRAHISRCLYAISAAFSTCRAYFSLITLLPYPTTTDHRPSRCRCTSEFFR